MIVALALSLSIVTAAPPQKRLLKIDDLDSLMEVSEPQISPDGAWVAYTLKTADVKKDERTSDVWMVSWDGTKSLRLTSSKESESTARFSPDGRFISFLSSRTADCEADQIWVMDRAGGEAQKYTETRGPVSDYAWAPDSKHIAVVVKDPDPECTDPAPSTDKKPHKPMVIDRFQFKEDAEGYLDSRRKHLYLLDVATRKLEALTTGTFNEDLPTWTPDSSRIAFVTKRGPDFDRDENWDIWSLDARPGAKARQLTTYDGADSPSIPDWDLRPAFSPDGKSIAYVQSGPKEIIYYAVRNLALMPADGGAPKLLLPKLDRTVANVRWSKDGRSLYFLIEEEGKQTFARARVESGELERISVGADRDTISFEVGPGEKIAVLASSPTEPAEIYAVEGTAIRALTRHNQDLISKLQLATQEEIKFRSKDGTEIQGYLMRPPKQAPNRNNGAILAIHGGPSSQFDRQFYFQWQALAAHGYVVVGANPRGSSGRGEAFSKAIFAAWGERDSEDVLAAVDHIVSRKLADPSRLGVGGWSYGGILTNQVIARDPRFKAAFSGAGQSNVLAGYGTDMYIREYEAELGPPWKNQKVWLDLSYPFLHADRIKTPTLFLCGDHDFNVPLLNSEQMYQALRSLRIDTQLIIYPGETHEIKKPSYLRDRLERYLAWFDKFLSPKPSAASRAARTP